MVRKYELQKIFIVSHPKEQNIGLYGERIYIRHYEDKVVDLGLVEKYKNSLKQKVKTYGK